MYSVYWQQFYKVFLSPCANILHTVKVVNLTPSSHVNVWAFPGCPLQTQSWYHNLPSVNLCLPVECSKQVWLGHSTTFPFLSCSTCLKSDADMKFWIIKMNKVDKIKHTKTTPWYCKELNLYKNWWANDHIQFKWGPCLTKHPNFLFIYLFLRSICNIQ